MTARLSSYRFRRRLLWTGGSLAVLAAIVGGSIWIGNTGKSNETPFSNRPVWVYHEPKLHRLTERERLELLDTSSRFVATAVARQHLDDAWQLLGPEMRAGQTRRSWDSGNNNVIPFPVAGIVAWNVAYSYENDVAFDLAVAGKPGQDLAGKTFTIELKRYPKLGNRWLVAAWVPKGVSGPGQSRRAHAVPPLPEAKAAVSAKWLLFPVVLLGATLLTVLGVALRSALVTRRSARRLAAELGYTSVSKPS